MKFRVYKKSKYDFLTTNYIAYALFSLTFLPALIISSTHYGLNFLCKILGGSGAVLFIVLNFYKFIQIRRHEKIWGTFTGDLIFYSDKILVNTKIYNISDINKIEIEARDYYKKPDGDYAKKDFNGSLSNGIDNQLIIIFNNGQNQCIHFEQRNKNDILKLKDILIDYYSQNKLSILKLLEALNITDYDEIQEFKKTLPLTAAKHMAGGRTSLPCD
jgi:hypothetical protein